MAKAIAKILIVDDDMDVLFTAKTLLKQEFTNVFAENNPENIIENIKFNNIDVVILDMNFKKGITSGKEGIGWLKKINELDKDIKVLLTTAYGSINLAVEGMKHGAADFITKPWDKERLLASVNAVLQLSKTSQELSRYKNIQKLNYANEDAEDFVAESSVMKTILKTIDKVAKTDANILFLGENGTGKDVLANLVHQKSDRADNPFVKVDLGAIPETLFESELFGHTKGAFTDAKENKLGRFSLASGGTLFLDEIGNAPLAMQSKLLTAIQNKQITAVGATKSQQIDVRIISATNKSLYEEVDKQFFREDLLYRINTIEIKIPPLRERKSDIPKLAEYFLKRFSKKYDKPNLTYSKETLDCLMNYHWPGNVREMMHIVERAVILSESNVLKRNDLYLRKAQRTEGSTSVKMDELEKKAILDSLNKNGGNISKTADELGIGRSTLYRKIKKYGIL